MISQMQKLFVELMETRVIGQACKGPTSWRSAGPQETVLLSIESQSTQKNYDVLHTLM